MAVKEDGTPDVKIKQEEVNGHTKGPIPRRKKPSSVSAGSHVTSILARYWYFPRLPTISLTDSRLTVWYVIIVALFQCPSSITELNESSPRICKPYINARSHIQPYLQPYYDTYAGPYVERARPYAEQLNQRVVSPAAKIAQQNYDKYAAPRLDQVKAYGQQQWQKTVVPQVVLAQKKASELYDASVAPHVKKASSVAEPYYGAARDNAINVHQKHIIPVIDTSTPYLVRGYNSTKEFALTIGLPYLQRAWSSLVIFVDGTLWPKVKGLYGDNVKPQLVMISERIAKYQEGRKMKAVMDEVESFIEASSATITMASSQTGLSASLESFLGQTSTMQEPSASPTPLTSEEQLAAAKEQIASDLHTWQEKFAVAADKGSEDLAERVREIVESLMSSGIEGEGKGFATALNKTSDLEMGNAKSSINSAVSQLPDDASSSDIEKAEKTILDSIRASGLTIRNRANAVRQWYNKFEAEINQRATAAADSTLDVLDSIRDLGLQEIGMRWAWMEGVTYKDWAKYHELKKQFEEWRSEVRDVALKHEILDKAKKAAESIVEDCMELAADAAKELARLKDVGKWKVAARDSSDDFDTRVVPAAAASAASEVAEHLQAASESILGTSQGTVESIASQATDTIGSAASSASAAVIGTEQGNAESIISKATNVAKEASSTILGETSKGHIDIASSSVSSAASVVSESASSATNALRESAPSVGESATSAVSDASSMISHQSFTPEIADSSSLPEESFASAASSSVNSVASAASQKVFAGAMAQQVSSKGPILDDIIDESEGSTYSEKIQSVVSEAGDRYADVTKAVSEALFGTTKGTVESVTSLASEQYSSALAAASSVLYGSTPGTGESIASVASAKYSDAVAAYVHSSPPLSDCVLTIDQRFRSYLWDADSSR
jgi:hypothetical protein